LRDPLSRIASSFALRDASGKWRKAGRRGVGAAGRGGAAASLGVIITGQIGSHRPAPPAAHSWASFASIASMRPLKARPQASATAPPPPPLATGLRSRSWIRFSAASSLRISALILFPNILTLLSFCSPPYKILPPTPAQPREQLHGLESEANTSPMRSVRFGQPASLPARNSRAPQEGTASSRAASAAA
jgi:hypothetical protein